MLYAVCKTQASDDMDKEVLSLSPAHEMQRNNGDKKEKVIRFVYFSKQSL